MIEGKLRRELGLRDVTLFAIACIVGTRWIPAAAHAGSGSIVLWLLAAVFLVIPLAVAVAALTVKYPGAGGLYLWTRGDFGPWHGFLAFWVYWLGMTFWFPSAAMFYMSVGLESLGPAGAHWGENRLILVSVALVAIWIAVGTNLVGMKIGKWTENLGGIGTWVMGAALVAVAGLAWMRHGSATPMHLMPSWNWGTVNLWATIAYAMTGLELAGMMGAEIHNPERTLPRAGWIASGSATLFYAATTVALLVLLRPEGISELSGLAQAAEAAGRQIGMPWLAPGIAILVMASAVGQFGGTITSVSRLPFAAAADGLLPAAFARVHPRWHTPHIAILAYGAIASVLLVAIQLGDTLRAAYQALVSLMVIGGFLPFVYIFASAWKAGKRASALSGWGVTAVALACCAVPTDQITEAWLFEAKLAGGTAGMIASGWVIYRWQARRWARAERKREILAEGLGSVELSEG
jgi:amino acid transporter